MRDPIMFKDSTVTGSPVRVVPTTMLDILFLRSFKSEESARIAIISDADTMSNLVSLKGLLFVPPIPETMSLRALSEASVTRDHWIPVESILGICPL